METTEYKILALDLGTHVGFAVSANGVIHSGVKAFGRKYGRKTKADDHPGKVFADFFIWLREQVALYKITKIVFEEPMGVFKNASARNVIVGMRGIVMAIAGHYRLDLDSVPQTKLKKFATDFGAADKDAMLLAAQKHLDASISSHNEADARWVLEWAQSGF